MKINITPLFIERGKAEATSVQLSISNDNLDNSASVQCAYYDVDDNLLKIVNIAIAGNDYSSYVNSGRSNATVKNFVLANQDLKNFYKWSNSNT